MVNAKEIFETTTGQNTISLHVITKEALAKANADLRRRAASLGFEATAGSLLPITTAQGEVTDYYVGAPALDADPFALGALASKLPTATYVFKSPLAQPHLVALGWALELYRYDPFRKIERRDVRLVLPKTIDRAALLEDVEATFAVRDMINAPANLFGPAELEAAARKLALAHRAPFKVISGPKLAREYPLIHVVGLASPRAPRLIDFTWGNTTHPKVTLVGKGVCFDTGGLDIKPSSGMLLMKKDMGGAANVLGLARLIMAAELPVRLRVLIPAVENSIAGAAFRPGDVYKTRKGLTVEIGNTDAEGRLVLCEALAYADEEKPDLLIDMATLTGAARIALGPDLPPFYTDDDQLALRLALHANDVNDPLWRLPLWRPYNAMIETPIADLNNAGQGGFAGSITAALFLRRFVNQAKSYVHFDVFGWTPTPKPGRPKGGEAQAIRALFATIAERFSK